ncbi:hypothetical protein BH09ACT1_BH09ACT1_19480 [soil metagenome]
MSTVIAIKLASILGIWVLTGSAGLVGSAATAATSNEGSLIEKSTSVDTACVSAVRAQAPGVGQAETIEFCTVTTATYIVDTTKSHPVVTSAAGASPSTTVRPAADVIRTFSQTATSALSLWQETHKGSFSFDGNSATPGWHSCGYGYRFAYDIANIRCSFTKPNSLNIIAHDDYRVSALIPGSPVSWDHSMSVVLTFDGMILPYLNT